MDDRLHPMPIIVILFSNQMLNTYKGKLWECITSLDQRRTREKAAVN